MNNVVLLAVFATIAFFVFPCDGESGSCPLPLKPTFLEGLANVMVSERFVFMSDFMKFCRAFERDRWLNLTQEVVCFGARDNRFASIVLPFEGFLTSIKLVHVTGHVSCDKGAPQYNSKWGCSRKHPALGRTPFNVVITTGRQNGILYPRELFLTGRREPLWYEIPDVDPDSPELVLGDSSYPYYVTSGQELRIWLGKDLRNSEKEKDAVKVCVNVKGWFMY